MANPEVPEKEAKNEPKDAGEEQPVTREQVEESSKGNKNGKFFVRTPWYIDTMDCGDGLVVTQSGVELNAKQRERAYEVARESGVTLTSKEV